MVYLIHTFGEKNCRTTNVFVGENTQKGLMYRELCHFDVLCVGYYYIFFDQKKKNNTKNGSILILNKFQWELVLTKLYPRPNKILTLEVEWKLYDSEFLSPSNEEFGQRIHRIRIE